MALNLVSSILKRLGSITTSDFTLTASVKEEVQKLESKVLTIQTVLNDAEKRQVKEEAVKHLLDKLKDLSYEMDDVVDEWNTAMIKADIAKEEEEEKAESSTAKKWKVWLLINNFNPFQYGHIARKIKELNGKLDEINREGVMSTFVLTRGYEEVEPPKTTSFVDVSEIYGCDKIKDDLVNILLGRGSEEERNPHVISLVGMGGIGKTTLAQLAYNDPKVQAHFDLKMWVCVSKPFDQCRVAKEILESIECQSPNITTLQSLMYRICELTRGKRLFLVLDDVWNEESTSWEPFKFILKYGARGSRILVTTRKNSVAKMMGSTSASMINLEVLSEEENWLMFSKIAFSDKNPEQCEQLEDLGRQIAKKCKGLPLVAKTLGSLLRFKESREQWRNLLDSNLWELEDVERSLFAPFLLSYYDLPSPLKRCFLFCAIFPKEYVFSNDELVFMWMAQGYIDSKENMEIIARKYFENLTILSFFQDFQENEDDGGKGIIRHKMHDIVHDFAQAITKNECFTIKSVTELKSNYKNARHLHVDIPEEAHFPVSIYSAKKLRTLNLQVPRDYNISNLFQHFRCLRALTLNLLDRELPDAVETFIHLRYLHVSFFNVDRLPETICNLCNLKILKITSDCRFKKLPQGMGKLINLRHFILDSNFEDWLEFPRGFGRLTSLRTLNHLCVSGKDDSEGCKLGELKDLNNLQGTLAIRGLGNVVEECEAKNAQLKKKIHLRYLKLYFNKEFEERMKNDASVLNAIEPPPNLEYLSIQSYWGTTMSFNWMMSLTKLKMLKLRSLENLEHLPPLGKLPVLESLRIECFNSLRKVGDEFLGIGSENKKEDNMQIFPNLKSLEFNVLKEWEEWIGIEEMKGKEEDSSITIMPRLQRLAILSCPKLKSLPNFLRTIPLKELEINYNILGYPNRTALRQRWAGEKWRMISHIPNIKIGGQYVQRDGQEVKLESDEEEYDEERFDEGEHAEEEFDKEKKNKNKSNNNNQNQNQNQNQKANENENVNETKNENVEEKKDNGGGEKKNKESNANAAVFKIDMHCEGCARKIERCIKDFEGVEDVKAEMSANKLTVIGKADPIKLRYMLLERMKRKVELVSGGGGNKEEKQSPKIMQFKEEKQAPK